MSSSIAYRAYCVAIDLAPYEDRPQAETTQTQLLKTINQAMSRRGLYSRPPQCLDYDRTSWLIVLDVADICHAEAINGILRQAVATVLPDHTLHYCTVIELPVRSRP
jgi:hypothetical protein